MRTIPSIWSSSPTPPKSKEKSNRLAWWPSICSFPFLWSFKWSEVLFPTTFTSMARWSIAGKRTGRCSRGLWTEKSIRRPPAIVPTLAMSCSSETLAVGYWRIWLRPGADFESFEISELWRSCSKCSISRRICHRMAYRIGWSASVSEPFFGGKP